MENRGSLDDSTSGIEPSIFEYESDSVATGFSDDSFSGLIIPETLQARPDNRKVPVPKTVLPFSEPSVKPEASASQPHVPTSSHQPVSQFLSNLGSSKPAIVVDRVRLDGINNKFAFETHLKSGVSQTQTKMGPPPPPAKPQAPMALPAVSSASIGENDPKTDDSNSRPQNVPEFASSIPQDDGCSVTEARPDTSATDKSIVVVVPVAEVKKEAESNMERPYKPKRSKPLPFEGKYILNLVDLTGETGEASRDGLAQNAGPRGEQIGPEVGEPLVVPSSAGQSRSPSVGAAAITGATPVRPAIIPRTVSDDGLAFNRFGGHMMSGLPRSRSAAAGSRGAGGAEINDIEIVHSILDGKFRRAQRLEDELAQMQDVIYDIDNKLGSIFDRDQEVGKLRDRCQRLQDALNEHRDRQASANEEVSGLRFKLQSAHDELKRIELNMAHQLARESDKLDLSKRINKQLRDLTERMREGLLELEEDHKGLKAEFAGVLEERDRLKSRIRERDREVEALKGSIRECERALEEQRERYKAIHEQCIGADAIRLANERLRTDLDNARSDLGRERGITASLEQTLKSMAVELEGLRCSLGEQHAAVTGGVESALSGLAQLLTSQEEGFKEFRNGISKLQADCENPQSELFKSIDRVVNMTDMKWTGVSETMKSLQKQQEAEMRAYTEKLEKWKGLKETLASQVQDLTSQLRDQQESIRALNQEKHGVSTELEKQRELNQCLVETTSKEKELNDLRLAEVSHKAELLEGIKREYLVRNSLLESTVRTLESKVEAEKKNAEVEKLALEDEKKKNVEELQKLREELATTENGLGKLDKVRDELEQVTNLATELKTSIAEEQKKSKEADEEAKALKEQLKVKDEQLSLAASRWTDISIKLARLEEVASAAKAEAQLRAEEAQSHRDELNEKTSKVAELEAERTAHTTQLAKLGAELEESKNEIKKCSAKSEALQKSFEKSEKVCDDRRVQIDSRDKRITELKGLLEAANTNIKSLNADLSEKSEEVESLQAEIEAITSRPDSKKKKGKEPVLPKASKPTLKKKLADEPLHHASGHKIGKLADVRRSTRVKSKSSLVRDVNEEDPKTTALLETIVVNSGSNAEVGGNIEVLATQNPVTPVQHSIAATQPSVAVVQPSVAATQFLAIATQPSVPQIQIPLPNVAPQNLLSSHIPVKRKSVDGLPTDLLIDSGITARLSPTGREPRKKSRTEETLDISMMDSEVPASEGSSQQDDLTYNAARHRNKRQQRKGRY
ncbi:hypothetical protein TWF718_004453 [Orbilia javanica]|uniref:Uncharacterized protein n=1 Tax=Orbilia javanica TaxID=47235 RepID=A0AAN8MSA3_9PEZI